MIIFDEHGMHTHKPFPPKPPRPCIFEYIYFSRPDSIVHGRSVYEVRKAFGAQLARESHVDIDVVVPVPDSGVPAAVGYSQFSGIPFELGIIRNHYVGRTFIQPTQAIRESGVKMKHSANRAMGYPGRDPANPKFADHCFTGDYPTHLTDQDQVEPTPRQLSLLAEAS